LAVATLYITMVGRFALGISHKLKFAQKISTYEISTDSEEKQQFIVLTPNSTVEQTFNVKGSRIRRKNNGLN